MNKLKEFSLLFKLLPSVSLFVLAIVCLIFDLDHMLWVSTLKSVLFGATIWQLLCSFSALLEGVIQE